LKDFKKLKPISMRPECEPDYDKRLWQPNWHCFCCHDTGFVIDRLAAYVIEGYISGQHKIAVCRATKCQAQIGETLESSGSLDRRLTPEICDDLDNLEREEWARSLSKKVELRRQAKGMVDELAERKSMRLRRRTCQEEMEVRRKHGEVIER
jgi:hypothetical protein